MILAAGRGKRMRPLTDDLPKPLLKVNQYSLIENLLFRLAGHGYREVVINVAHLGSKIMAALGDGERYGVNIVYSEESDAAGLETGGGIYNALPLLGRNPFLAIAGDIWTDYPFSKLKGMPLSGLAHLILVDNPGYHQKGDFNLVGEEIKNGHGTRLTFGSIGVYHPELFAGCQPGIFPLAPLLDKAVELKKATGEYFKGDWVNVGTPEDLIGLRQKLRSEMTL